MGGKHRPPGHGRQAWKDRGRHAHHLCSQTPRPYIHMAEPTASRTTRPQSTALEKAQEVIRALGLQNRGAPLPPPAGGLGLRRGGDPGTRGEQRPSGAHPASR